MPAVRRESPTHRHVVARVRRPESPARLRAPGGGACREPLEPFVSVPPRPLCTARYRARVEAGCGVDEVHTSPARARALRRRRRPAADRAAVDRATADYVSIPAADAACGRRTDDSRAVRADRPDAAGARPLSCLAGRPVQLAWVEAGRPVRRRLLRSDLPDARTGRNAG